METREEIKSKTIPFQLNSCRDRRINPLPCSTQAAAPEGNTEKWQIAHTGFWGGGLSHGCGSNHACWMQVTSGEFLWSSMGYSLPWQGTHLCLKCVCPSHTAAGHGKSFQSPETVGFILSFSEGGIRDGERNLFNCFPLGGCFWSIWQCQQAGGEGLWAFPSSSLQHPALLHHLLPNLILGFEDGAVG